MKTRIERPRWTRVLRWLILLLFLAALAVYILLPAGFGVAATLPAAAEVGPSPAGFEAVALQTEDGVSLAGWYTPPTRPDGAAILLLHGAGDSREGVRPYSEMLARNGYGVLALDARGHGRSDGRTNRLGWQGTRDVKAGVDYLQSRGVQRIGGLGLSMGGEMLLGAAAEVPALSAIAVDGATRRSTEELLALPSERPLVRNFTARVMYTAVRLFSGEQPPAPLLESMLASGDASFLLIAAGENELEVAFNQLFAETLGDRAELWVAPGVPHTGAFARYPGEYEERVIGFFDRELARDRQVEPSERVVETGMSQRNYRANTLWGAAEVASILLTAPISRGWYNRWGATDEEVARALPGDDLVPSLRLASTHAITINAPAAAVWPWLVQMGQGRGGLYSYDGLENLIGCDIHSADRILSEYQELKAGDHVLFGPAEKKFPGQVVAEIEPGRAIVMYALDPATREAVTSATWAFLLDEQADGTTRLLVRSRNGYEPTTMNHIVWHIVEPIAFVMERQMLRGLKARAEAE